MGVGGGEEHVPFEVVARGGVVGRRGEERVELWDAAEFGCLEGGKNRTI